MNDIDVNHKLTDTKKIVDYVELSSSDISVDGIIRHSGSDKLRVYPALFELE